MPDGDIFQRSLRGTGRGWVVLARLADHQRSFVGLGPAAGKAVSDSFRRIPAEALDQCAHILLAELDPSRTDRQLHPGIRSLRLESQLRGVAVAQDAFDLVNIVKDAVRTTHASLCRGDKSPTVSQTLEALGENLAERIFDNRVSRVRGALIAHSGRNVTAQREIESPLRFEMRKVGGRLMAQFAKGKRFRAPVLARRARPTAADMVRQPIQIL